MTVTNLIVLLGILGITATVGCRSRHSEDANEAMEDANGVFAGQTAEVALEAMEQVGMLPSCGTQGKMHPIPDTLVVFGSDLALSCAPLGHTLRSRQGKEVGYAILTAKDDLPYICEFVAAEKVAMPVYGYEKLGTTIGLVQPIAVSVETGRWYSIPVKSEPANDFETYSDSVW